MTDVLWIIGANATGKTTQSKSIHGALNKNGKKEICTLPFLNSKGEADKTSFTLFDNSAHVGALRENQCTGTDSLSTKEQIEMSYYSVCNWYHRPLILIDGIMATASWVEMIKFPTDIRTHVALLHFKSVQENLRRVQARRAIKKGFEEQLSEKTIHNVTGKWRGFENLFNKVKDEMDSYIKIEASRPVKDITNILLQQVLNF